MSEIVNFRTKRTGVINTVVVGSVVHKRLLAEPENYELVSEKPKKPEKSG